MAMHTSITLTPCSETTVDSFFDDAEALDKIIEQLHGALDAEALVSQGYFEIALVGLAHSAADAWATCETSTMLFLMRPTLAADHVLAAEHLLDVLQDRGLEHARICIAPVALLSAAARCAGRPGMENIVLKRQMSQMAGLLRAVIEESALPEDPQDDAEPRSPSPTPDL